MLRRIRHAFRVLTGRDERDLEALMRPGQLPPIGNPSKLYPFALTEPEINAIHSASAFIEACCRVSGTHKYWGHYGPTLKTLSERLAVFDD